MAKVNPKAFLAIHEFATSSVTARGFEILEMNRTIADLWKANDMVGAIKFCRTNTGWGLKEAKDYCDALAADRRPEPGHPFWDTDAKIVAPTLNYLDKIVLDLATEQSATGAGKYEDEGSYWE